MEAGGCNNEGQRGVSAGHGRAGGKRAMEERQGGGSKEVRRGNNSHERMEQLGEEEKEGKEVGSREEEGGSREEEAGDRAAEEGDTGGAAEEVESGKGKGEARAK